MTFDGFLRRNFWLVPLPLLAIVAGLNAEAIGELAGLGVGVDAHQLALQHPSAVLQKTTTTPERVLSAKAILERNPFDHVTGSLLPRSGDPESSAGTEAIATSDPWSAPTCDDVDVQVIAESSEADESFAAVTGSDKKTHVLRRNTEVSGKKVYFIGADRVWLSGGGALCQALLFDAKKPSAPPPAPPPAAPVGSRPAPRGAAPLAADLRKGIQAVSATEFNIDRSVVDRILENQADLMRQARVTPVQENGRVVGVRLNGIRPDTLLGVLGMQNGDRLDSINGFELASPEKALEAYARLRTADKLTIQLNRGGKKLDLDYNIR